MATYAVTFVSRGVGVGGRGASERGVRWSDMGEARNAEVSIF